jgi:hypothetical protein
VPGQYKFDDTLNRGLLTKFVQSIRKMFNMGPQYDSAFQDLVVVTDRLLRAGPAPKSGSTIMALAKKVTAKENKTLNKIAKSNVASDMNAGVGELMMQTRNAKDAVRLLRASYDAMSVGSLRTILSSIPTEDVSRAAGDRVANIAVVNDTMQDMATMRTKMIRELAEKAERWAQFNLKYEEGGRALADVMNASTLLGIDPTLHATLADALQNDVDVQQLRAEYQTAMQDPAKSPKQRSAAKAKITARENNIKAVYQGGVTTNPLTKEKYPVAGWEKLGTYGNGEGQRIYRMAMQAYKDSFALHLDILTDKITKSSIPGVANQPNTPKGQLIAQITQAFQEAQQLGVYFPLMRYGNHWLRIGEGKSGEFYMFESAVARNSFAQQRAEAQGKSVAELIESKDFAVGDNPQKMAIDVAESSQMLKDIFKSLDTNTQVDPVTGRAAITDIDAIKDQVYQMFLMTLPDRDLRRRFTHRQGKTGFSADALRNFVVAQHTSANQLARLAYADKIRMAIASAYAELEGNPDNLKLETFVDEIAIRATEDMTPQPINEPMVDKLATVGNQAVFFYMLTAPKSALVQLTQLPIVGLPTLAAKYGFTETSLTAARYLNLLNKFGLSKRDANGNVITTWGEPSINDSSYVNKHPDLAYRKALKQAWQAGQDMDLFMSTFAADTTARAQTPSKAFAGRPRRALRWVGNFMSGAFHHFERIAREIMYMSTFELEFARAKKEGLDNDAATTRSIKVAAEMLNEGLFNYTQYNKPRKVFGLVDAKRGIGRIPFQFMSFPIQMTSFLIRNAFNAIRLMSTMQERKEAAIKLFGTLGMTWMFAGVVGQPLYSFYMGVAEGVREALRPDMEDEDADLFYDENDEGNPLGKRNLDLWFREWFIPTYFGRDSSLANALGLTDEQALVLQRAVKMGPISAMTDWDVGASTSLDGLWFRNDTPAATSKDAFVQQAYDTTFGPLGGMVTQIISSFDDFNNGDFNKGVEKLLPAFFRGAAKSIRLAEEGEKTRQGVTMREVEDYSTGKLVGQALGFKSTETAELQKKTILGMRMAKEIEKDRLKALNDLDKAVQKFEADPSDANQNRIDDALIAIDRFNYKNGFMHPITGDTISKSLEGRAKRRMGAIEGLVLTEREGAFIYPLLEKTRRED